MSPKDLVSARGVSAQQLAEIETRLQAATPYPWHLKGSWDIECPDCGAEQTICDVTAPHEDGTEYLSLAVQVCGLESLAAPNADFIAHAPADVAALMGHVTALRAALAWALGQITDGAPVSLDDPDFEVPPHPCEFTWNPEKGACDYHEAFVRAAAVLGTRS